MWSRSSPTRQFPFRAVSTSTRCPSAFRSPAVFAATASFWTRPRRWNRPLPTSPGSDARAPTLASSPGLRSTSNRLRPTRPYRPRPLNADFRWSSSAVSSELDLDPLALEGRSVTYGFGELDMLVPAYAATIHKSQGSEYPAVISPVLTQHYPMLRRNLLYTGVTRGKRLVVLVGQKKAVAIAVRNASGRRRWSKLAEWLRPGPRKFGMAGCG